MKLTPQNNQLQYKPPQNSNGTYYLPNSYNVKKQGSQPSVALSQEHPKPKVSLKNRNNQTSTSNLKPERTSVKHLHAKKAETSGNRTSSMSSSNSKSRISANISAMNVQELDHYNSQTALKLKKLIGDSNSIFTNKEILKQINKENGNKASQSNILGRQKPNVTLNQTHKSSLSAQLPQKQQDSSGHQYYTHLQELKNKTGFTFKNRTESTDNLQQKLNQFQVNYSQEDENQEDILTKLLTNIQTLKNEQHKKNIPQKPIRDNYLKSLGSQYGKYKCQMEQILEQQGKSLISSIYNSLIEFIENSCLQLISDYQQKVSNLLIEQDKVFEMNQRIKYEKGQIEQERDILLETIKDLKNQVDQKKAPKTVAELRTDKEIDLDQLETGQMKQLSQMMQEKIQEMSEKENKLIKLVLAIKRSGIDIEKIYNEEVLNDESSIQDLPKKPDMLVIHNNNESLYNDADNSIVNDSDESSFNFQGRQDNDSIIESIRRFEMKYINNEEYNNKMGSSVKFKLDFSQIQRNRMMKQQQLKNQQLKLQQQQMEQQKQKVQQSNPTTNPTFSNTSSNLSSVLLMPNEDFQKQSQQKQQQCKMKLDIEFRKGEPQGFHQEFMGKINQFSESWRMQALKEEKGE